MPVSYPATLPTSGVTRISWSNMTSSLVSRSPFTYQGQAQSWGGAIRIATVTVENLNREQAEDWIGFLDSLRGTLGTFLFGDPMAALPLGQGGIANNPRVAGANQSGDTLNVRGAASNTVDWLKRGDWVQIGAGVNARLYKVVQDVTTSSSTATLTLWPNLRTSYPDNTPIVVRNPVGLFRRSDGVFSYEQIGCNYSLSFNIEEVV